MIPPFVIVIILTGALIVLVNFLAKRKLKRTRFRSESQKKSYQKMINKPLGGIYFLLSSIK